MIILLVALGWFASADEHTRDVPVGEKFVMAGRSFVWTVEKDRLLLDGQPVAEGKVSVPMAIGPLGATRVVVLHAARKGDTVRFRHGLERRGEVLLAGRLRTYVLVDSDQDLRFSDPRYDYVLLEGKRIDLDDVFEFHGGRYRFVRGDPTGSRVEFALQDETVASPPNDKEEAQALLKRVLAGDDAAADLLRRFRSREAMNVIVRAPRNTSAQEWERAIALLGSVNHERVAEVLLSLRRRQRNQIRRRLVQDALLSQDGADVVKRMLRELDAKDIPQRRTNLRALFVSDIRRPAVRATIEALLEHKDWKWRALTALELRRQTRTLPPSLTLRLVSALQDEYWPVKLAAAEALERARYRDVIPPMIDAMEREKSERIRRALGISLYRISGTYHRGWPPATRRWWNLVGERFTVPLIPPPRDPPTKKRKDTGERKSVSSFFGINVQSSRVIFLIDASGSMGIEDRKGARSRFDVALDELEITVRTLPAGAKANVVFFSDKVWSWKPRLTELTSSMRKTLRRQLSRHSPRGGTYLFDGFEEAFRDEEADTIVLLSDGNASGGKIRWPDEILDALEAMNSLRRVTIHCIAIGYHNPMLKQLAASSGGQYAKR